MGNVDFRKIVTDVYGDPVRDSDPIAIVEAVAAYKANTLGAEEALKKIEGALGEPLSLGRASVRALSDGIFGGEGDKDTGEKKLDRFRLASEIADSEKRGMPLQLDARKITLVKSRIGKLYLRADVVGRCWDLIEPTIEDGEGAGEREEFDLAEAAE